MFSVVQANLNHSRVAQDLLDQYMVEQRIDVAILSDPYQAAIASNAWLVDSGTRRAAIWVPGHSVSIGNVLRDPEFVSARINGVQVFSCYASPNQTLEAFSNFLQRLEDSIRLAPGVPVLVAGDFNARSAAWGDRVNNRRGVELSALFETLELVVSNTGTTPTFNRGNGSVVDVTATSESLVQRMSAWRVLDDEFNYSDHHYIRYALDAPSHRVPLAARTHGRSGWSTSGGVNLDAFSTGLALAEWLSRGSLRDGQDADTAARNFELMVSSACDYALPKKRMIHVGKPPVHWWSSEIAELRAACVRAKRAKTRMVARVFRLRRRAGDTWTPADNERAEEEVSRTDALLRETKRQLKNAIRINKKASWTALIESVDRDPFGKPYKIIMRKLRGPPATVTMEEQTLRSVIDTLFPAQQPLAIGTGQPPMRNAELFTLDEVNSAIARIRSKKTAPGPDAIHSEIVWAVHASAPNLLLSLFNLCLRNGTFPCRWKESRVVLLRKGTRPEGVPSSYRPLCLLNDVGKVLEFLLARRLEAHIGSKGGLAPNQYGFRKGLSTDDAIRKLQEVAVGQINSGNSCLAVSIDIKNAFNSIGWPVVMRALDAWEVPLYLLRMFGSYFSERSGAASCKAVPEGSISVQITGGVPQGSVVGPLLWNLTYNTVLTQDLPAGAELVGFADDTLVLVSARTIDELEGLANDSLCQVARTIDSLGLSIAAEKTDAVLFSDKYKHAVLRVQLCGTTIPISSEITYLGVVVDQSMLFKAHIRKAAAKAEGVCSQLARLMPNIGGPKEPRRRLLSSVAHSVLLYGAPSWAHTLKYTPANCRTINRVQRKVLLRYICAYRTVSETAANVLSSTPPADLLARERELMFVRRRVIDINVDPEPCAPIVRAKTIKRWKKRIAESTTGAWTTTVIGDVERWCLRPHGQLTFHTTQILSGHGCFGKFLHKIRKEDTDVCHHCWEEVDDAAHTLLACPAWEAERRSLSLQLGSALDPSTIMEAITSDRSNWQAFEDFCHRVMSAKEAAERLRRSPQHQ